MGLQTQMRRALLAVGFLCLIGITGCGGGSDPSQPAASPIEQSSGTADETTPTGPNINSFAGQPTQFVTTFINEIQSSEMRVYDPVSANLVLAAEDSEMDGVDELVQAFSYDLNDCNTTQESFDPDGVIVSRISFERRADCAFVSRTEDSGTNGADGIVDRLTNQEFDTNNQLSLIQTDNNGNGVFDRIERLSYDSAGNLVLRELDFNGDGIFDNTRRFEYAGGEVVREAQDANADGIIDRTLTTRATSNAVGALCSSANCQRIIEIDEDNDGTTDSRQLLERDPQGNELRWVVGYEPNGTHNGQETRRTFNSRNQVTSIEIDVDADGLFERSRTFSYNEDNNLLDIRFTQDGAETFRESYDYEDWTIGQLD